MRQIIIDGSASAAVDKIDSVSTSSDQRVNGTETRNLRRAVKQTQWAVAAPCTSEQFKLHSHVHKPQALRWDRKSFAGLGWHDHND